MELLTFDIGAGESKIFQRAGRLLEVIDAAYPLTVKPWGDGGAQGESLVNVLSGLYLRQGFSGFEVQSATAQSVTLMVTDSDGGSRRQPGLVRVVDQGAEKTRAGLQFITSLGQAASVGQNAVVALQPNGRRLIVKKLSLSSTVAGRVQIGKATSLGTASGAPVALDCNKLDSGAAPLSRYALGYSAGIGPTGAEVPGLKYFATVHVPASTQQEVPLTTPLVFEGTSALILSAFALNRDVALIVDFEEES